MNIISLHFLLWNVVTDNGESFALVKYGVGIAVVTVMALVVPYLVVSYSGLLGFLRVERRSLDWLVRIVSTLGLAGLLVTFLGIVGLNKEAWLKVLLFGLLGVLLVRRYFGRKQGEESRLVVLSYSVWISYWRTKWQRIGWLVQSVFVFGLACLIVFCIGIVGINIWVGLVVLLFGFLVVLLAKRFYDLKQENRSRLAGLKCPDLGVMIVFVVVLLIGPIIFYHALAFPIVQWDSMIYNAPIANYLYLHGVFPTTIGVMSGFGMATGAPPVFFSTAAFFYTLLDFNNDVFLRLLSPVFLLLLLWVGYEVGREVGGSRLGVLAVLVLLLTPAILYGGYSATYQTMLGVFVGMSVLFVIRAERTKERVNWLCAGWFIGLSGLCSYNGYFAVLGLILMVLLLRVADVWRHGLVSSRYGITSVILMLLIAMGLNIPWWIRNVTVFNTPIHPFFTDSATLQHYNRQRVADTLAVIYEGTGIGDSPTIGTWIDFFLWRSDFFPIASSLTLLGAIYVFQLKRRGGYYLLVVAGVFWLTPIIQPAHHRLVVLVYCVALAVLSAIPLWWIVRKIKWWQYLGVLVLIVALFSSNIMSLLVRGRAYRTLDDGYKEDLSELWAWNATTRNADAVISDLHPKYYSGMKFINENLKPDKKVALTSGAPSYYFAGGDTDRIFFLDSIEAMDLFGITEENEIRDYLKERDVQYIFWSIPYFEEDYYGRFPINKFLDNGFPEVASNIYEVE